MTAKFSFNKPDVSDEEITNYINRRDNITVITFISSYNGIPHMCPVWGGFFNGKFFFQSEDYSFKIKSIKNGSNKIGVSIIDPRQFPEYLEGEIPYVSLGGLATVRTKKEFTEFEKILRLIFRKYVEKEEEQEKLLNFVLEEVKTRVLIEVLPEWVKARKVPKSGAK
ncbi:MAG: hypothetical protein JSW11_02260 [Candidatus Heimdallarchaeota archaeon]|nr:MAG: hypothetical protein JSW11_02260 [Candidatus Heimdallarchaeota archaeon]